MGCYLKVCSKCKDSKPLYEFYKDRTTKDGYYYQCRDCAKQKDRAYRKTKGYRRRLRNIKWAEQGINITHEQYEKMFADQDGKCAICGTSENQLGKGMCVDHDHNTGEIRGLLCTECNLGIGHLKNDAELVMKAAQYLTKVVI